MPEIGTSFIDDRISMTHWHPQISDIDSVRQPDTHLFKLEGVSSPMELLGSPEQMKETVENIPVDDIIEAVDALPGDIAHIRGDYKAARLAGGEGTRINTDPGVITKECLELLDSCFMMNEPITALAVREYIEMETLVDDHMASIHPEIRFIVDEGDVLGWFVDVHADDFPLSVSEDEQQEILADIQSRAEAAEEELTDMAAAVAEELDDSGWSVDFIQSESGEWYLTDMALYGLWWDENASQWRNISHIPDNAPYNLETNTPEWVPDQPTDDMVRVDRRADI